jgi:hypothetical protein
MMWNWLVRELVFTSGMALLIAGGYWQGRAIGRWEPLRRAPAADLAAIPVVLDSWMAADNLTLEPGPLQLAGVDSYLARNYEHDETGEVLSVLVLSGAGGPLSVHPPDACVAGRGYRGETVVTPVRVSDPHGGEHRFAMTIFRAPPSAGDQRVQLFWAWSLDGAWSTPFNPRLTFARHPRVYKLYVSRFLRPDQGRQDVEKCLDFMNHLLPELQRVLAESPSARDAVTEPRAGRHPSLAGRDGEIRR